MLNYMKNVYPRVVETILKSIYMDDTMDTVMMALSYIIIIRKSWYVYLQVVVEFSSCLVQDYRMREVDIEKDVLPSVKTLGVVWVTGEDAF